MGWIYVALGAGVAVLAIPVWLFWVWASALGDAGAVGDLLLAMLGFHVVVSVVANIHAWRMPLPG